MSIQALYFDRFPTINYLGYDCKDITRRVKISDTILRQPLVFYPLTIIDGWRPDTIAFDYYNDEDAEWMIYLANGITDPYYDWYLTMDQFDDHLVNKYGSIDDPQLRIKYWKTNWDTSVTETITPDHFQNSLTENQKKYWIPNYGQGSKIISYRRREEDWFTSTNRIDLITLENLDGDFARGDLVDFRDGAEINVGFGEVVQADGNQVRFKNLVNVTQTPGLHVVSHSGASGTLVSSTTVSSDISLEENIYWAPVTFYDYENTVNEGNKTISLIDVNYINVVLDNLRKTLA